MDLRAHMYFKTVDKSFHQYFNFHPVILSFFFSSTWILSVSASCARGTTENIPYLYNIFDTGFGTDNSSFSIPFGYSPTNGPMTWHTLHDGVFKQCAIGQRQSPIDITTDDSMDKETQIKLGKNRIPLFDGDYSIHFGILPSLENVTYLLENIGTTIEMSHLDDYAILGDSSVHRDESYSLLNGVKYHMKQIHFHSPSEHKINGFAYPLEAHIVHQDIITNRLFVLSILFESVQATDITSYIFSDIFSSAPSISTPGSSIKVQISKINLNSLSTNLEHRAKFLYRGSLTTPPCTEGVSWLVVREPLHISFKDEHIMRHILQGNSRYTQTRLSEPNVLASVCPIDYRDTSDNGNIKMMPELFQQMPLGINENI